MDHYTGNMSGNDDIPFMLSRAGAQIDRAIQKKFASHRGPAKEMYKMLEYFMGYRDERLRPVTSTAGKRFRSALCMLIAEQYGAPEQTLDVAVAIELFHNFSLIHDDIEDGDAYRRHRPTLWKLFGLNHAINAGDAQLVLVGALCSKIAVFPRGNAIASTLFKGFSETIEGQYLDFTLASETFKKNQRVRYLQMIDRKTGALVGASAESAGIVAGKNARECATLQTYGRQLGIAYQLVDDYRSFWHDQTTTGKDAYGDIRERKHSLPFLLTHEMASDKRTLEKLYSQNRQLTDAEIDTVRAITATTNAQKRMRQEISKHVRRATQAVDTLTLPPQSRGILKKVITALVPELSKAQ